MKKMRILRYIDKMFKFIFFKVSFKLSWGITWIKFKLNGVKFHADFVARGIPIININLCGFMSIGQKFVFHSGKYFNMIGRQQHCYFIIGRSGNLQIGDNVGISCTAIVCHNKITIDNDVRIGGGVVIYDTDFHSINYIDRISSEDLSKTNSAPIIIKKGAFIGAHSIILKGVIIGENSVVGAGSVVSKSIPDNEIWAGNPAKFIKSI